MRRHAHRLWGCSVRVAPDREVRASTLQDNGTDSLQRLKVLNGTPHVLTQPSAERVEVLCVIEL